jgi:hypothetical protein
MLDALHDGQGRSRTSPGGRPTTARAMQRAEGGARGRTMGSPTFMEAAGIDPASRPTPTRCGARCPWAGAGLRPAGGQRRPCMQCEEGRGPVGEPWVPPRLWRRRESNLPKISIAVEEVDGDGSRRAIHVVLRNGVRFVRAEDAGSALRAMPRDGQMCTLAPWHIAPSNSPV